MAKLVAPDKGVSGVNVELANGSTRAYDLAKDGTITVDNARDAAQLKREGFFEAAGASFSHLQGFLCSNDGCTHDSVFRVFTCPKCGTVNGKE
jgi:hypothetical protein